MPRMTVRLCRGNCAGSPAPDRAPTALLFEQSTHEAKHGEAAAGRPPALALEGIVKSWGTQPVLTGVDARIEPGSTVAIFGANGAGKTTLLRIAAGPDLPGARPG